MSKDLLLEIGTEEIPAHFMPGILSQLKEHAEKAFAEKRISFQSAVTMGTPRRVALLLQGVADKQEDVSKESKGPSVQIAFDAEGNPSKAGAGFARGQKVDPKDLVVRDGYVYAMVHEKGEETAGLLPQLLTDLVQGLNFPKNMRWADLDFKFVRPLRWLVALLDDAIVPFTVAGVSSGRISRGHRFLSQGDFSIASAAAYEETLKAQFVLVDQEKRRTMIRQQIEELAAKHGGKADITEDLLEEVIYLVEYPTALCGSFEEKYLELPPETVITPMREHQRYFPVLDAQGKLLPLFITVRNGNSEHLDIVQHGNERVLRARLADAQFFFDEDRKQPLEAFLEKLKTVVFQDGLGTIYDKTQRLEELAGFLGEAVGADAEAVKTAKRAAKLAKADLVTGMVCEFTELQGIMGREYALLDGETKETAQAVYEHYMPRFAGDAQPSTVPGLLVSLADKMDNLVATFSRGLIPTGSQDPFALRRQALGMVNSLIEAKYSISLQAFVNKAMDLLHITDAAAREKMQADIAEFMRLRLKNVLGDAQIRYDIADAVLGDIDDLYAVFLKAQALSAEAGEEALTKVVQAFVRAGNLAQKTDAVTVDEALFQSPEERELYAAYVSTEAAVNSLLDGMDFCGAIDAVKDLAAPIDAFFDVVMVMDKVEAVKDNRLHLLRAICQLTNRIADFSKIVTA